jgi:hypothetical protein
MDRGQEQLGERILAQAAAIFSARSDVGAMELLRAVEKLDFEQTEDGYRTSTLWHDCYWAAVFYIDAVDIPSFDDEVLDHLLPTIAEVAGQNGRSDADRILVKPALRDPAVNWRQTLEAGQSPALLRPDDVRTGEGKQARITEVTRMQLFDTFGFRTSTGPANWKSQPSSGASSTWMRSQATTLASQPPRATSTSTASTTMTGKTTGFSPMIGLD